jgi:CheY-like chemotaxis protein
MDITQGKLTELALIDVVIMDLTVPGRMGGKEAIGRLRKLDPLTGAGFPHGRA